MTIMKTPTTITTVRLSVNFSDAAVGQSVHRKLHMKTEIKM